MILVATVFMVIGSLIPIWSAKYFPSQNGPQFLLITHMLREFCNPEYNYDEFYVLNIRFIPHLLHNGVVYCLSFFSSILTAHRLALSLYALLLPASVYYFLKVVAPRNRIYALVSFLYIYNYSFMRGYNNFTLSIPFFFLLVGYWLHHQERLTIAKGCLVVVLSCVVCLGHLLSFLLFLSVAGVSALLGEHPMRRLLRLTLCALPCSVLVANYLRYSQQNSAKFFDLTDTQFLPFHTTVENLYRKFLVTFFPSAALVAAIPILFVLCLVGVRLLRHWIGRGRADLRGMRALLTNPVFAMLLLFSVLYFALPWKLLGWHKVNARMIPFIAIALLGCAAPLRRTSARVAFVGVTCAAALVMNGMMAAYVRQLGREIERRVAAVSVMKRNAVILPLLLENPQKGEIRPFTRLYDYYNMLNGGATGWSVARLFNTIVPVVYKKYPVEEYLPLLERDKITSEAIREVSRVYDYVLVFGYDRAALATLMESDLKLIYQGGAVRVFEVCDRHSAGSQGLRKPPAGTAHQGQGGRQEAGRPDRATRTCQDVGTP